jgi:hypothetical protein
VYYFLKPENIEREVCLVMVVVDPSCGVADIEKMLFFWSLLSERGREFV